MLEVWITALMAVNKKKINHPLFYFLPCCCDKMWRPDSSSKDGVLSRFADHLPNRIWRHFCPLTSRILLAAFQLINNRLTFQRRRRSLAEYIGTKLTEVRTNWKRHMSPSVHLGRFLCFAGTSPGEPNEQAAHKSTSHSSQECESYLRHSLFSHEGVPWSPVSMYCTAF